MRREDFVERGYGIRCLWLALDLHPGVYEVAAVEDAIALLLEAVYCRVERKADPRRIGEGRQGLRATDERRQNGAGSFGIRPHDDDNFIGRRILRSI